MVPSCRFAFTAELKDSVLTSIFRRATSSQKSDPTTRRATDWSRRIWQNAHTRSKKNLRNPEFKNIISSNDYINISNSSGVSAKVAASHTQTDSSTDSPAPRVGQLPFATALSVQMRSSELYNCHRSESPQKAWFISHKYHESIPSHKKNTLQTGCAPSQIHEYFANWFAPHPKFMIFVACNQW